MSPSYLDETPVTGQANLEQMPEGPVIALPQQLKATQVGQRCSAAPRIALFTCVAWDVKHSLTE